MKGKVGRLNGVSSLIMGIVTIIMGIILLINPEFTLTGLCTVVGTVLMIAGAVMLILYFAKAEYMNHDSSDFAVTITLFLAGLLIMIRKKDISDIFPQFVAIFILVSGVLKMQQAMDLLSIGEGAWGTHFLIGIVIVILSGIVLIFPDAAWFKGDDKIPVYMCILLVLDGICSIICLIHATVKKNQYREKHPSVEGEAIEKQEDK